MGEPKKASTKRPLGIYFVAGWCFVLMLTNSAPLSRLGKPYKAAGQEPPLWIGFLCLVCLVFIIWQAVGLIRLRRLHRWICILFLSLSTVMFGWNAFVICLSFDSAPEILWMAVFWLIFSSLNIASIWYLARPNFRNFCCDFAEENRKAARPDPDHSPS